MANAQETTSSLADDKQQQIFALTAKIELLRGQVVTPEQKQAAREYDRQLIDAYLHAIPRTQYMAISGKQIKSLNDIATTYGAPMAAGDDVDLVLVIRWFHEWLSTWGPRIKKQQMADEATLESDREREKLELRRMQAQIAKIESDVERRRSETISIEEIRKILSWLAGELRKLGERLGKRFGADAQIAMNEALARIEISLADDLVVK
jgi:uncharacterized protein (DUF2267 family)